MAFVSDCIRQGRFLVLGIFLLGGVGDAHFVFAFTCGESVNFEQGVPIDWDVFDYDGNGVAWSLTESAQCTLSNQTGADGVGVCVDAQMQPDAWAGLRSPGFSLVGQYGARLEFRAAMSHVGASDYFILWSLDTTNGWQPRFVWQDDHSGGLVSVNLDALAGESEVYIEFAYDSNPDGGWVQVDEVQLFCSPSSPTPPNIVLNAEFDSDILSWESLAGIAQWDSLDSGGSPASGSALVSGSGIGATFVNVLFQCLPVQEGVSYDYSARVLIPSGQPGAGYVLLRTTWYQDSECQNFVRDESVSRTSVVGAWEELAGTVVAPIGAQFVRATIGIGNAVDQGDFDAHFDSIHFGESLQLSIFADGFESGGLSRWSISVP
ncbi:MAG: hypothetical protein SX243_12745 [Acidobacteriota bacterium]|nr:hypothetical protein [Acidobacteriota bacterium]